jgi:hypothetical protein
MCSFAGVPRVPTSESDSPFRASWPCQHVGLSQQSVSGPAALSAAVRIGLVPARMGHASRLTLPLPLQHFRQSPHFFRLVSGDARVPQVETAVPRQDRRSWWLRGVSVWSFGHCLVSPALGPHPAHSNRPSYLSSPLPDVSGQPDRPLAAFESLAVCRAWNGVRLIARDLFFATCSLPSLHSLVHEHLSPWLGSSSQSSGSFALCHSCDPPCRGTSPRCVWTATESCRTDAVSGRSPLQSVTRNIPVCMEKTLAARSKEWIVKRGRKKIVQN